MGQLVTNQNARPAGALPSDTEKNPQVNAVTLRNRRELEEVPKKRKDKPIPEGKLIPKVTHESKNKDTIPKPVEASRPPPPFPQRLQKKNDDRMFSKFLFMLRHVQLNIPLVDVLREIPKYVKYIKDIVAHKRRLNEFETVALTEECTSRIQNKLPQKLKDPDSFTIPVRIGNIDVGRALCDLGASINLMPLSLFKQLGLGAPRPTTVMLQLADRSTTHHEGVIEDVLLQIGKYIFPADFIILDYEADELVPIISGRPLLATGDAIIKVRDGKMILRVDDEEAVFNIYKANQLPRHYEELSMISVVEADEQILDTSGIHPFEPLNRPDRPPSKPSIEEAPKLELKPLPPHLQYAYLGDSDTLHEEKLLRMPREHKRALGWAMSDIKGISPAFCMHKILMEDGHKPSVEQQRRLNPIMKEVVRKEVIKWLDADMKRQTWLLEKDVPCKFDDACLKAFEEMKGRLCTDQLIRRCVPQKEMNAILHDCRASPYGGHYGGDRTAQKVLQSGFYLPKLFKDAHAFVKKCDRCQRTGTITKKHEMPLQNILVVELFDVWGIDFMGPFLYSNGHRYILVAVDYVSKWVEAISLPTNDAKVVVNFVKKHIFTRFGTPRVLISGGGTYFCNKLLNNVLVKYGVKHKFFTAYHPK
ncbi:uncharacterized protein [Nicotiana sylvestris]|uniref:uncharacterized protein n=1 Tax=Nicotiana sylvestris TaxID=4096 RepID=UPI00388CE7C6